jgi:hypothetical protein
MTCACTSPLIARGFLFLSLRDGAPPSKQSQFLRGDCFALQARNDSKVIMEIGDTLYVTHRDEFREWLEASEWHSLLK